MAPAPPPLPLPLHTDPTAISQSSTIKYHVRNTGIQLILGIVLQYYLKPETTFVSKLSVTCAFVALELLNTYIRYLCAPRSQTTATMPVVIQLEVAPLPPPPQQRTPQGRTGRPAVHIRNKILPALDVPAPTCITATRIDFGKMTLAKHCAPNFALLLDNVLTPAECQALLTLPPPGSWQPAVVRATRRDPLRVLVDAHGVCEQLWARILPHLPDDVVRVGPESQWGEITGKRYQNWSKARAETGYWEAVGLNERLRFLKYEPGMEFSPHCDALYAHGEREAERRSFLTAHMYLSDGDSGAARFWAPAEEGGAKMHGFGGVKAGASESGEWIDVKPRIGRVLVFQQRGLLHNGEPVVEGGAEKYTVHTDVMYKRVVVGRDERKRLAETRE